MKIFGFCHACALAMGILSLRFGSFQAALEDTISPDFSKEITYLGDASFNAGTIELTLDPLTYSLYNSSGRALYSLPVRLLDPFHHSVASFSTSFSFTISPAVDSRFGDGLAFIIVADRYEVGDSGFELGVYRQSTTAAAANHTFAVEFDTHKNQETGDMNGNHVGIDLTSATSVIAADAAIAEVILTDSAKKTSWIDYDGDSNLLEIRLSNTATIRPENPLISASINLSQIFHEYMFVGFAAATGGSSQELHSILSWNFSTSWGFKQQSSNPTSNGTTLALASGLSVAFIVASIAAAVVAFQLIRRGRRCAFEEMEKEMIMPQTAQVFSYKEIRSATRGFSDAEKLGYGGFGSVFRGVLPRSGAVVAVKRLHVCEAPKPCFLAEVNTIACLRHRNLVRLYGWCSDGVDSLFLVSEYLPNGSLHRHLFLSKDVLPWTHRYTIVCGIAAALLHLHEDVKIVHRDVKPSNVILDCNFNAKLGDFGLARQLQHAQRIDAHDVGSSIRRSRSSSRTVVAGTFGYIAPEAVETGKSTTATDVFSFGAVLLEVGCGRRALDRSLVESEAVLVDHVWDLHQQGKILAAADQRLGNAYDVEEMTLLLKLGLLCSHPDPSFRPTMKLITLILSREASLPPCNHPTTAAASRHTPAHECCISIDQLLANSSSCSTTSSDTPHASATTHQTIRSMDDLTTVQSGQSRKSSELMTNSFQQLMI